MPKPSPLAAAPPDAATALLLAAERLFAEHGPHGVSLRQINVAAGQRNASAAHYHFGSREGVVRAVFEFRMSGVNRRRLQRFDTLERDGRLTDPRALIETWVLPLADELEPRPGGNHYIRFLHQVVRVWPGVAPDLVRDLTAGWRQVAGELRRLLGHLPPALIDLRLEMATQHSVAALAQAEQRLESGGSRARARQALYVANLIDVLVAGVMAPASPRAMALLS